MLPAEIANPVGVLTASEQSPSAPPATIRKPADESVTNSAVLQNDDSFSFPLQAGKSYVVEGALVASTANGIPDIKIAFVNPTASDMNITYVSVSPGTNEGGVLQTSGTASTRIPLPANTPTPITISGTIVAGADGDLQLQWAQFAANANAVTIQKGSYLRVTEI